MPDNPNKLPIGDPPLPKKPVKSDAPMRDPFTDLPTHPAGDGQGENKPEPATLSVTKTPTKPSRSRRGSAEFLSSPGEPHPSLSRARRDKLPHSRRGSLQDPSDETLNASFAQRADGDEPKLSCPMLTDCVTPNDLHEALRPGNCGYGLTLGGLPLD